MLMLRLAADEERKEYLPLPGSHTNTNLLSTSSIPAFNSTNQSAEIEMRTDIITSRQSLPGEGAWPSQAGAWPSHGGAWSSQGGAWPSQGLQQLSVRPMHKSASASSLSVTIPALKDLGLRKRFTSFYTSAFCYFFE